METIKSQTPEVLGYLAVGAVVVGIALILYGLERLTLERRSRRAQQRTIAHAAQGCEVCTLALRIDEHEAATARIEGRIRVLLDDAGLDQNGHPR